MKRFTVYFKGKEEVKADNFLDALGEVHGKLRRANVKDFTITETKTR